MNSVLKEAEALVDKSEAGFESAKQTLSKMMENGSEKLIAGAEVVEGGALHAAESLLDGATYLREQRAGQMMQDCQSLFKKYPIQAMTVAALAGVFLGKSIWGSRPSQ